MSFFHQFSFLICAALFGTHSDSCVWKEQSMEREKKFSHAVAHIEQWVWKRAREKKNEDWTFNKTEMCVCTGNDMLHDALYSCSLFRMNNGKRCESVFDMYSIRITWITIIIMSCQPDGASEPWATSCDRVAEADALREIKEKNALILSLTVALQMEKCHQHEYLEQNKMSAMHSLALLSTFFLESAYFDMHTKLN